MNDEYRLTPQEWSARRFQAALALWPVCYHQARSTTPTMETDGRKAARQAVWAADALLAELEPQPAAQAHPVTAQDVREQTLEQLLRDAVSYFRPGGEHGPLITAWLKRANKVLGDQP
ncbi:MAG TPA: hypothetical protein VJA25_02575 [Dehalococcoidia bacterium]|nr:hypothetical protein [Dehalococcoidia bacterium]